MSASAKPNNKDQTTNYRMLTLVQHEILQAEVEVVEQPGEARVRKLR